MLLGIDIGTSSVKVSVVDEVTQICVASATYPESEAAIIAEQPGWAEQSPDDWWMFTKQAIQKLHASKKYHPKDIAAIGIAYQMHGLVLVDKEKNVLRNSIIWCDSRSVDYGEEAFNTIGHEKCLNELLNSPGNFTAAKLAWVKSNEPGIYEKTDKVMLPGDFIAMKLTGNITTSAAALSEGIFWNFKAHTLSRTILDYFGFDASFFPDVKNVFDNHGYILPAVADELGLQKNIPVTYKAGDQPNNALSLNVMEPGEVAANAGTSGVIYGVTDQMKYDPQSRINSFAHVNHTSNNSRIGVLLCINGAGITSNWIRSLQGRDKTYDVLNGLIEHIPPGSNGLTIYPFGNGAERMLGNRMIGAALNNIDFNNHTPAHIYRAGLEGVAFAFRYGLDIMQQCGIAPSVIRAGYANMFLSKVFTETFVNTTGLPVELFNNDGSCGAAIGAGMGAGLLSTTGASNQPPVKRIEVTAHTMYDELYGKWKEGLEQQLKQ